MRMFYLDASAWVKRYQRETGSDWMARIWLPAVRFACASLGLIEVQCTIARRHAANGIDQGITDTVLQAVRRDFDAFVQVRLEDAVVHHAEALAARRRLRGADCVHLASAMRLRESLGASVTIIASDADLLAAAVAEGFDVLDPNQNPAMPSLN